MLWRTSNASGSQSHLGDSLKAPSNATLIRTALGNEAHFPRRGVLLSLFVSRCSEHIIEVYASPGLRRSTALAGQLTGRRDAHCRLSSERFFCSLLLKRLRSAAEARSNFTRLTCTAGALPFHTRRLSVSRYSPCEDFVLRSRRRVGAAAIPPVKTNGTKKRHRSADMCSV